MYEMALGRDGVAHRQVRANWRACRTVLALCVVVQGTDPDFRAAGQRVGELDIRRLTAGLSFPFPAGIARGQWCGANATEDSDALNAVGTLSARRRQRVR